MRLCKFWLAGFLFLAPASLFGQEQAGAPAGSQEPTLPPLYVRPETRPEQPEGFAPGYGAVSGAGEQGISWNSGAITSDTMRVGPYGQPAWTTARPFATTRAYVLPAGEADFEQWVRPTWPKEGDVEYRLLEEISLGLPGRFQLDLYERWNVEPDDNGHEEANHEGVQIELRWALADWGVIPLNPTLYAEWIERGGPQEKPNKYELKLLLSEEITCRLFWATNFILEQEAEGEERETELAWSNALSTPLIERKLLVGVESVLSRVTTRQTRDDPEISFLIGPSLHWIATNRIFVDVVGLFGTTSESPTSQMYVVAGYQFGTRAGPSGEISAPTSTRGR